MALELVNCNSANYNFTADWNSQDGNVSTVGSNGTNSFYGTYDQAGNVWELLDSLNGSYQAIRGGAFNSIASNMSKDYRSSQYLDAKRSNLGFRIAKNISNTDSYSSFVDVTGSNTQDTNSYGAVAYDFKIQTYPVTNAEYAEFLNAVAVDGSPGKELYHINMGSFPHGGIERNGEFPTFSYVVKDNMEDKPINFINWFNAVRFINWISNGMTNDPDTTETGVYTLNGTSKSSPLNKNSYWLPTENEWYKSAYYDPDTLSYSAYSTKSNILPDSVTVNSVGYATNTATNPDVCISPTPTNTHTASVTPTNTLTATPTHTSTQTATASQTPTATLTASPTNTATASPTPTNTQTSTVTHTPTHSSTVTPTRTPTNTTTATATPSPTPTNSSTPTVTPTVTKSQCPEAKIGQLIFQDNIFLSDAIDIVYKGFVLSGKIVGQTVSVSEGLDVTPTTTPTQTPSHTSTPTYTPSNTPTSSVSPTPTYTPTQSKTPQNTPTQTSTHTPSLSPSPTQTHTGSPTPSVTSDWTIIYDGGDAYGNL